MESFCNCTIDLLSACLKISQQFPEDFKKLSPQIDGVMVPDGACWYKAQMIAYIVALVCNCVAWVRHHFLFLAVC